jgi:hypothetical protein
VGKVEYAFLGGSDPSNKSNRGGKTGGGYFKKAGAGELFRAAEVIEELNY